MLALVKIATDLVDLYYRHNIFSPDELKKEVSLSELKVEYKYLHNLTEWERKTLGKYNCGGTFAAMIHDPNYLKGQPYDDIFCALVYHGSQLIGWANLQFYGVEGSRLVCSTLNDTEVVGYLGAYICKAYRKRGIAKYACEKIMQEYLAICPEPEKIKFTHCDLLPLQQSIVAVAGRERVFYEKCMGNEVRENVYKGWAVQLKQGKPTHVPIADQA